jgi:UDP-glucose 4-epimerase
VSKVFFDVGIPRTALFPSPIEVRAVADVDTPALTRDSVLVTGACGHLGRTLCRQLRQRGFTILATDIAGAPGEVFVPCDIRQADEVPKLFVGQTIGTVIHLAGILPGAFLADPIAGAEVNLAGSVHLLRQSAQHSKTRFIFASSMSVYGSSRTAEPLNEDHSAIPDEPYGAAKRAVELVGESLADAGILRFVALRIARVVGPGIKKTSSPWRSQIFDASFHSGPIQIPFAPGARVSLVHVEDVARMFVTLVEAEPVTRRLYNTPAEIWRISDLRETIERHTGATVEFTGDRTDGGPLCDGKRFAEEFEFQLRGLITYLAQ